ncbi:NADPH-dependent FMN reductase [Pelagovum pacificum]|uniref:NAD(P)H-dependent oxidoreductase n=1 Tax=Pelagovum pacificum TaxID=2588711 RepID=A0A5C5G856_9RHOB|nr:NAD(P)H-dependent oxidoreductase [Pelagovum pacificum]QQA41825.1 NAD(P)H-dependent oxidoreductase [Pelagovum pacificum]TNY30731.1 NAD(P)H-dependent oxidoreductase [Pelagovum pacificum]
MTSKPRIAIVIGSTRATRFADKPAAWLLEQAQARTDIEVELVDLRDFDLPLFDEPASDLWMPSESPEALKWQEKIATFDGFVFMVAEYNHSITGALKNALDQAYTQWVRKPFSAMGYGGVGAARAVEHLRGIGVELQMAPIRPAVHLGGGELMKVHPLGADGPMSDVHEVLAPSAAAMFDDLVWWANVLKEGRAESQSAAA